MWPEHRGEFKTELHLNSEIRETMRVLFGGDRKDEATDVIRYASCTTCGQRGVPTAIEGGVVYLYPCTSEVVILHSGGARVLKTCPDIGKVGRADKILTRSGK